MSCPHDNILHLYNPEEWTCKGCNQKFIPQPDTVKEERKHAGRYEDCTLCQEYREKVAALDTKPASERESYERSIAISLKRMEIDRVRDLKTWSVLRGFRDFHSSNWIALCEKENQLEKELSALLPPQ